VHYRSPVAPWVQRASRNSFPNTTFAQNNGVIQLTGVAARAVGLSVGGILCVLGLVPWVGHWIALLPGPVLGAMTFLLFGFVASAGIRILQRVQLGHRELLILAFSLGVGIGVQTVPELLNPLPEAVRLVFSSGITTGGISAFVLNAVLPSQPGEPAVKGPTGRTPEPLSARPSEELGVGGCELGLRVASYFRAPQAAHPPMRWATSNPQPATCNSQPRRESEACA
jgi:Permease family